MDPVVNGQVFFQPESFPTIRTGEGFLFFVDLFVANGVGFAPEPFPAVGTGVGLLARVDGTVRLQVSVPDKAAPAVGTLKGPFSCVDAFVGEEVGGRGESSPAVGAGIGLYPCVGPLVDQEVRVIAERLAADRTLFGFGSRLARGFGGGLALGVPLRPTLLLSVAVSARNRFRRSLSTVVLLGCLGFVPGPRVFTNFFIAGKGFSAFLPPGLLGPFYFRTFWWHLFLFLLVHLFNN